MRSNNFCWYYQTRVRTVWEVVYGHNMDCIKLGRGFDSHDATHLLEKKRFLWTILREESIHMSQDMHCSIRYSLPLTLGIPAWRRSTASTHEPKQYQLL